MDMLEILLVLLFRHFEYYTSPIAADSGSAQRILGSRGVRASPASSADKDLLLRIGSERITMCADRFAELSMVSGRKPANSARCPESV